jgi:hypothetical protein
MAGKGTYINIYMLNNRNYINYEHSADMKGTIYGNRLPRGTASEKFWEPMV